MNWFQVSLDPLQFFHRHSHASERLRRRLRLNKEIAKAKPDRHSDRALFILEVRACQAADRSNPRLAASYFFLG